MCHVGISDVQNEQFHQAHKLARGAAGLAGVSQSGQTTEVWLDRWELDLEEDPESKQASLRIDVDTDETQLQLTGTRLGPTIFRGDQGLAKKFDAW